MYLGGRILSLPLYAAGVPKLRTFSWNLATPGLVLVGLPVIVRLEARVGREWLMFLMTQVNLRVRTMEIGYAGARSALVEAARFVGRHRDDTWCATDARSG
jgi:hypothetical protein